MYRFGSGISFSEFLRERQIPHVEEEEDGDDGVNVFDLLTTDEAKEKNGDEIDVVTTEEANEKNGDEIGVLDLLTTEEAKEKNDDELNVVSLLTTDEANIEKNEDTTEYDTPVISISDSEGENDEAVGTDKHFMTLLMKALMKAVCFAMERKNRTKSKNLKLTGIDVLNGMYHTKKEWVITSNGDPATPWFPREQRWFKNDQINNLFAVVVENLKRNEIALDDPKNRLPKMETTWTHEKYRGSTVAKNWKQYCDTNTDEKKKIAMCCPPTQADTYTSKIKPWSLGAKTMQ